MTYERIIETHLSTLAGLGNGLFTTEDLRALLPDLASGPMRSLLHRLCKSGYFVRLTRNLFLRPVPNFHKPDVLFHMAAKLRDDHFNYLSLETVLSREGYISQVPMQWISLMSSGRSYTFRVKEYGTIEFVHTKRKPTQVMNELHYEQKLGLWVASSKLALDDMNNCKRDLSLVSDNESI